MLAVENKSTEHCWDRPAASLRLRHLVALSNQFVIARLPPAWIYWLAMPHEIWHFIVARALGLRVRVVPGATLFYATARWHRIVVLLAPAMFGVIVPVAYLQLVRVAAGTALATNWPILIVTTLAWWSGCLGDFLDVWLLVWRRENVVTHHARMQRMLERYQ